MRISSVYYASTRKKKRLLIISNLSTPVLASFHCWYFTAFKMLLLTFKDLRGIRPLYDLLVRHELQQSLSSLNRGHLLKLQLADICCQSPKLWDELPEYSG